MNTYYTAQAQAASGWREALAESRAGIIVPAANCGVLSRRHRQREDCGRFPGIAKVPAGRLPHPNILRKTTRSR